MLDFERRRCWIREILDLGRDRQLGSSHLNLTERSFDSTTDRAGRFSVWKNRRHPIIFSGLISFQTAS